MLKKLLSLTLGSMLLISVGCSNQETETIKIDYPCKHYLYAVKRLKIDPVTHETYYGNDYLDLLIDSKYPIDSNEKVFKDSEGRYYYFVEDCSIDH